MVEKKPKMVIYNTINNMKILNNKITNPKMLVNFHSIYTNIGFLMNKNNVFIKQNKRLEEKVNNIKRFKGKNITVIGLVNLDFCKKIYNKNGKIIKLYKIYNYLCCIHDIILNKYYSIEIKQYKYYSNINNGDSKMMKIKDLYFAKTKLIPLDFEMLLYNYGTGFMHSLFKNYFNFDDVIKYLYTLLRK